MFGLTGDAHLEETQECYKGTVKVVTDAEAILAAIEAGEYRKTASDVADIIKDILADVDTCEKVSKDAESVDKWVAQISSPLHFAEDAGRNYLNNRAAINGDVTKEMADWKDGNYWQAGVDTAHAIALLFGPTKPDTPTALYSIEDDAKAASTFVGGLLFGLTADADLVDIQGCYEGSKKVVTDAEGILATI